MLTGENGILNKAQDTKGTNAYVSAVEQVKLAYMAVKTEIMTQMVANSSYDATNETEGNPEKLLAIVNSNLTGSEWTPAPTYNSSNKTIEITYTNSSLREGMVEENKPAQNGKIEFEIGLLQQDATLTIDGELVSGKGPVVKDKNGKPISLSKIASYYGHEVTYNNLTYQLFYIDTVGKYSNGEPRIWLQLKDYISGVKLSDHYETTGIATAGSILWQVNPDLDRQFGTTIRGLSTATINGNNYNNLRKVAYLCNSEKWNENYIGTSETALADIEKGVFAIGGVSAEMFCDSYNQARGKTCTDADFFTVKAYIKDGNYGYRYKPAHTNSSPNSEGYGYYTDHANYAIQTSTASGMYRPNNLYPWLASPSCRLIGSVCFVNGNLGYLRSNYDDDTNGVRPAVSLPANIPIQLTN